MEKTKIISHTFKSMSEHGYTYEITFSKSLENTCRMNAMTRGLDRFDKWRSFWRFIWVVIPIKKISIYAWRRF